MELWDIYDIDRVRTGRVAQRGKPASEGGLGEGEYHLVVHICVFNGRGQLLLQQRQKDKEGYPNLWDVSAAGSALAGENSAAAASRELREELGLVHDFTKERPFLTTHFERGCGRTLPRSSGCWTAGRWSPTTAILCGCGL